MKVHMEQEILQENEKQAEENRTLFGSVLVVNLIGSPGCGKTTLLEHTAAALYIQRQALAFVRQFHPNEIAEAIIQQGAGIVISVFFACIPQNHADQPHTVLLAVIHIAVAAHIVVAVFSALGVLPVADISHPKPIVAGKIPLLRL